MAKVRRQPPAVTGPRSTPATITPAGQLAPVYGGPDQVALAIANAQELARQTYPGMGADIAGMFPMPDYSRYNTPVTMQPAQMPDWQAGVYNRALPGEDMPYDGDIVTNPDYAGEDFVPFGLERPITDMLLDGLGDINQRNNPLLRGGGYVTQFSTPAEIDRTLAQVRRRAGTMDPDVTGMVDADPQQIAMLTGMSPDDVAIGEFAQPGSGFADVLDEQISLAEQQLPLTGDAADFAPDGRPTGLSVASLIALRDLMQGKNTRLDAGPGAMRQFLGKRMGMLPAIGAIGVGTAAAMSGDRDRPSMSTDATMQPRLGY